MGSRPGARRSSSLWTAPKTGDDKLRCETPRQATQLLDLPARSRCCADNCGTRKLPRGKLELIIECRPLVVCSACGMLFRVADAPLLPLYSQGGSGQTTDA
jgi:hypothetical protein